MKFLSLGSGRPSHFPLQDRLAVWFILADEYEAGGRGGIAYPFLGRTVPVRATSRRAHALGACGPDNLILGVAPENGGSLYGFERDYFKLRILAFTRTDRDLRSMGLVLLEKLGILPGIVINFFPSVQRVAARA